MSSETDTIIATLGDKVWEHFQSQTNCHQHPDFEHLLNITMLNGQEAGSCRVLTGGKVVKGSYLSISMGPFGRYMNIHLIPEPQYDVPRLVFEGMISPNGSQVTVDLFPDKDFILDLEDYLAEYTDIVPVFDEAHANKNFSWEDSRMPHMRALFSPYRLLAFKVAPEHLSAFEGYALQYLKHWLRMLEAAEEVTSDVTEIRLARRAKMKHVLIDKDPDRYKVVDVFGEEITSDIEHATML